MNFGLKNSVLMLGLLLGCSACVHCGRPVTRTAAFPIFNYHHVGPIPSNASPARICFTVTPGVFRQQMRYFKDHGYTPVALDVLTAFFDRGTPIPPKAVAITFDDGWEDQYRWAFPVLVEYGFRAAFFIPVDWVGHPGIVTWTQLRDMRAAGMTIGTHGAKHYHFDSISDDLLRKEIVGSRKKMEEHLSARVDYLAYPGGHWGDRALTLVRAARYRAAMGVQHDIVQSSDLRYNVRRFHADNNLESIVQPLRDANY